MLSADLELADLDARHWKNWWRLLTPPGVLAPTRWALAVLDRGTLCRLIIRGEGVRELVPLPGPLGPGSPPGFPPPKEFSIPVPHSVRTTRTENRSLVAGHHVLAEYKRTLGVSAVIAIERRLIAELSAEIEAALRIDQDLVAQGLVVLRALKKHAGRGLWTEPPILELLPAPSYEPLQRTFDLLVPDRSAMLAYVIEDDRSRIHASILAVKSHGDITRAGTHRAIDDLVPEAAFARDWDKDYRRVLEAARDRFARPSVALFVERATLLGILTGPSDQLARELNAKRVVIDPAPAWLLGLLGGAAVAAIAGRAASALANMLPQATRDRATAIATRARDAIKESGADPFALLGFDPIELWSRLKHYYRP